MIYVQFIAQLALIAYPCWAFGSEWPKQKECEPLSYLIGVLVTFATLYLAGAYDLLLGGLKQ